MDSRIAATVAGAAATAPMTAVMMALHRTLPGESNRPLPPRVITENAADMDGMDEGSRDAASLTAHFSFGAAAGVAYVPLAGKSGLPPAAEGALFGVAVWGASYLGLMPATGLYNSAKDEPAQRNLLMITAHLVWGASLGVIYNMLSKREIEGF
jgi:uncharacterized membrane protein YagU involved in acid resistance